MKRLYFLLLAVFCGVTVATAQVASCAQVLRLVRTTYEQGRLHEIPDMMRACLNGTGTQGFNKVEKREALRYLTLTHIYLEEPEQADAAMMELLETDHFYEINDAVDPAEFIALYKRFRTRPLFRVGLRFGPNYTMPTILNNYYVGAASAGQGAYSPGIGFQLGVAWEKDLFKDEKAPMKFTLAPEINFISGRSFSYTNSMLTSIDGTEKSTQVAGNSQTAEISQSWMDLNAIVQYRLKNGKYNWYAGLGPGLNMIMSSSNQVTTTLVTTYTVTGPAVDDTKSFNQLNYSAVALAGGRMRVGEIYVSAEVRYSYGINNVVNPDSRSNPQTLLDYGFQHNDFRINTLSVSVGLLYPYFKPKKLIN